MGLKRKRSDSAFSPSSTTSVPNSDTSSPSPDQYGFVQEQDDAMMLDACDVFSSVDQLAMSVAARAEVGSNVNSRTRKRYRSNRPDDEIVYGADANAKRR